MFNNDGPELLYVAVADYLAAQIASGALKVGQRLPSERKLAEMYGVAYMTVRRAMKELRERGVVVSVHGKGTYVAQPSS